MATSKLTRNSSSLSRSPTIKAGIDSLSSLEEALVIRNLDRTDGIWSQQEDVPGAGRDRRPPIKLLAAYLMLVFVPCIWWYIRVAQRRYSGSLTRNDFFLGAWFDCLALILMIIATAASFRVLYPHLSLVSRLKSVIYKSWTLLTAICIRCIATFCVTEKERKEKGNSSSVVTWTIGSKPKSERSKIVKEGVQVYSNGDVYEGEFHQGRCSGSGVYHFYMSGRYEGDWVDGKYDGYGVETWARGSRYRGQYRQGLREGYGVYRFYTGDVYSGEWSNGQSHGRGVQTCEDGSRYVGEFKWGVKHGFGYYYFRNGDTYAGEYFADKMHGYGVYQFANGHRYEGAWHEGKRQGLGMYTFRNGETQAGYWHGGTLQTSSTQNPLHGVQTGITHSKILHVVQEARRAATKAYEVPRVDDRVNKAVAAANRAANAARLAAVKAVQRKIHGSLGTSNV